MKKIREVLKSKSGQGVPMILAVVLCCLILACVTFEYGVDLHRIDAES